MRASDILVPLCGGAAVGVAIALVAIAFGATPRFVPNKPPAPSAYMILSPVSNGVAAIIRDGICVPGGRANPNWLYRVVYLPEASDNPCSPRTWRVPASQSQLVKESS